METISIYKKHLTLSQRIKIENGLNNNLSFRKIALDISKGHNTVAREVKERRVKVKGNKFNMSIMECPNTRKAPFVCNGCDKQKNADSINISTMQKKLMKIIDLSLLIPD